MLYERRIRKTLQVKPTSHLVITEWSAPRATPDAFDRLLAKGQSLAFEGREVPVDKAGKLLSRRCHRLLAISREEKVKTSWRVFFGSDRAGPDFAEDVCRRVDRLLIVGFSSVLFALSLETGKFEWSLPLVGARFRAVRVPSEKTAVIVHGTCSLYRIRLDGRVEWETFGAHDFGDGLRLCQDVIEVRDIDRNIYLIDYRTGDFAIRPPPLSERLKESVTAQP